MPKTDATAVFTALADPTRRELLEAVASTDGITASTLATRHTVSRQAIAKHLTVLADAGLVEPFRVGREVRHRVCPQPLRDTATWLAEHADTWDQRLGALKAAAEAEQQRRGAHSGASAQEPGPGGSPA